MKRTTPNTVRWLSPAEAQNTMSPESWDLISCPNSLTQKLRKLTDGQIEFHFLNAGWDHTYPEESEVLNLPNSEPVWIRNVEMRHHNALWAVGRALVPKNAFDIGGADLEAVGKQSLGDVIFKDPNLKRSAFEFLLLNETHPYHQHTKAASNKTNSPIWARRSFFDFRNTSIFIVEIFFSRSIS